MPIWLLTGLGAVRKAAVALLALAGRYPWQAACIVLLLASAWLWHGWDGADAKLKDCQTAREADRKSYVDAQFLALQKAEAAKAATEKKYADLAETTDANEQKARTDAMADADEYIRTHRLPARPASGPRGGTVASPEDHSATSGNGPGDAPELDEVAVTPDDIRICTGNTVRLEAVRTWALDLTKP